MKKIKVKYKDNLQKAELGLQKVEVPQAMGFGDVLGGALGLGSSLGQLGSNFGPLGSIIGTGAGALGGLIKGLIDKRKNREAIEGAKRTNNYFEHQSQYDVEPTLYANDDRPVRYRKGSSGIKVKYKEKETSNPMRKSRVTPDSFSMFNRDMNNSLSTTSSERVKYKPSRKPKYKK